MENISMKLSEYETDWGYISDSEIPVKRVAARKPTQKRGNYFHIPANNQVGEVIELCKNCFVVYALLTTAQAMYPREEWHTLPHYQLEVTGLNRHQVYRVIDKLETAGIVESKRRNGHKTRYRIRL